MRRGRERREALNSADSRHGYNLSLGGDKKEFPDYIPHICVRRISERFRDYLPDLMTQSIFPQPLYSFSALPSSPPYFCFVLVKGFPLCPFVAATIGAGRRLQNVKTQAKFGKFQQQRKRRGEFKTPKCTYEPLISLEVNQKEIY